MIVHAESCPIGTASSEGICTCGADRRTPEAMLFARAIIIYAMHRQALMMLFSPEELADMIATTERFFRGELQPS